ncbi:sensor histidine kinase [Pseudomonadota bacterium]
MVDTNNDHGADKHRTFLPDFCNIRIVFSVIIIAEMLAIVLTLASPSSGDSPWNYLSLVSLFIQWVALVSTASLCVLRPLLAKLNDTPAAIVSYLILIAITVLFSELGYWVSHDIGTSTLAITSNHPEFIIRNVAICAIASFIVLRYFFLSHQLKLNIEAENQYRLQALQARIHPHFLFNSLNTIASLIRREPRKAEEAVENLADLFRDILGSASAKVPLSQELETTQRYLEIEQLRLGTRLNIDWDVSSLPLDTTLPALTLQPLLENAIYHGVETLADGGKIHCLGIFDGKTIIFSVTNPVATNKEPQKRSGLHMAIDNIQQRLQVHFGDEGRLIVSCPEGFYQVELRFPYIPYRAHEDINC